MGREGGQSRASHTQGPGSCPKGLWEIPSPGLTKLEPNVEAAPAGDMHGRSSPEPPAWQNRAMLGTGGVPKEAISL